MRPIKAHELSHSVAMAQLMQRIVGAYLTLKTAGHDLFRGSLGTVIPQAVSA